MKRSLLSLLLIAAVAISGLMAQTTRTNKKNGGYQFTIVKEIGATSVKDQNRSGTCWCFSSNSFLESELIRMGKGEYDLSEMWVIRQAYLAKAKNYIRMMGKVNFGEGGEPHDVMNMIRDYGIVPQSAYPGKQPTPDHAEMDAVLAAMMEKLATLPGGKLSNNWLEAVNGVLDAYLGKAPEQFDYNGKTYTPKSFAQMLGINPDDYVEISSFTHHPFYQKFVLEVPDNWANGQVYNVPLDEMEAIVDASLQSGYPVEWASDVSEKGFSHKNGVAIVPAKNWEDMSQEEKDGLFEKPSPEKVITQEMRQEAFDNLSTQDDHGMQFVGIAKDQNGNKYYLDKNSWGTAKNDCGGYLYVSAPYMRYKTTGIMVNKNAIPKDLAKKLNL